jgi:putative FmdB family regulatory protein
MPLYTYTCKQCGKVEDAYRPMSENDKGPDCCGQMMKQIIVPPMIAPSMPEYQCPVTGENVTSRKRRKEIMKEHNLVERG